MLRHNPQGPVEMAKIYAPAALYGEMPAVERVVGVELCVPTIRVLPHDHVSPPLAGQHHSLWDCPRIARSLDGHVRASSLREVQYDLPPFLRADLFDVYRMICTEFSRQREPMLRRADHDHLRRAG